MHGGTIYIRGPVEQRYCGAEVGVMETDAEDAKVLEKHLKEYCADLGLDMAEVMSRPFKKLIPVSSRPYGNLYAY